MQPALRLVLAAAASATFYGLGVSLAPAGILFVLFVPLPGLLMATRAGSGECSLWLVLTVSAIAAAFGVAAGIGFLFALGFPTFVLAEAIRRSWSLDRAAFAGIVAWTLGIACLSLFAYGDVHTLVAAARAQVTHSIDLALSTYGSIGAADSTVALMEAERDQLISGIVEVFPALVVLTGAVVVLGNLVLVRRCAKVSPQPNLHLWRVPDALIWVLIITGFGLFLPSLPLSLLARNLFIIILACYFCQGLAIVAYYLDRFRLPRGIRIAGYVLIAVQHVLTAIVLALGIFDLWGNFRRLNAGPADIQFHSDGE